MKNLAFWFLSFYFPPITKITIFSLTIGEWGGQFFKYTTLVPYKKTRLLERFEPIFFSSCEHFLFVKQNQKKLTDLITKFCRFSLPKIEFCLDKFLNFSLLINFPWGHVRSNTKFGTDRFSRFYIYWIQTDKQSIYTDTSEQLRQFSVDPLLFSYLVRICTWKRGRKEHWIQIND